MSQVISEVIGVIEMELDAEHFEIWTNRDVVAGLPGASSRLRQNAYPVTPAVVLADVTQLSDELRFETTLMLQRLLKLR